MCENHAPRKQIEHGVLSKERSNKAAPLFFLEPPFQRRLSDVLTDIAFRAGVWKENRFFSNEKVEKNLERSSCRLYNANSHLIRP